MDDKPNYELREQIARKPPGEAPTIEEIRELKKIEAERVNRVIARGVRPEDQSKVWHQLWTEGRCLPSDRPRPPVYVTGLTALNLPDKHGDAPDWHSHQLAYRDRWTWSGIQIHSTTHLLKREGIYDATDALRRFAPDTPEGTPAATWERAIFDLLYHFSKVGEPVPNIQYKDIDHLIDVNQIIRWIEVADLPVAQKSEMLAWLQSSE